MPYISTRFLSGKHVYGIRNASRGFLSKGAIRLSIDEAALIVGMLKRPDQYNPLKIQRPLLTGEIRCSTMVNNEYSRERKHRTLRKKPIRIKYKKLDENLGSGPLFP